VVIGAVDQNHLGRCPAEGLGGGQAPEASADDDDPYVRLPDAQQGGAACNDDAI
jgi:hypothetical protein